MQLVVAPPIPAVAPIPAIESTIWSDSSNSEKPSTDRRSSRLVGYSGCPIRGASSLPRKVMDSIEVIPVPNAAPAPNTVTI